MFCSQSIEDSAHLFFFCPFSQGVWAAVFRWLGKTLPTNIVGWNNFLLFGELVKTKKGARVSHLIWLATTWNLWKLRNNVLFNDALPDASSLVDDIKAFSWVWFKGHRCRNCCILFSKWCIDALAYFQSL
jgi:hypothetical protein